MVVYSFYIFDRHAACIFKKKYIPPGHKPPPPSPGPRSSSSAPSSRPTSSTGPGASAATAAGTGGGVSGADGGHLTLPIVGGGGGGDGQAETRERQSRALSAEDDAKLVFGTVFSLRNMVRKLGGEGDNFVSYRTAHYKLHYYETPTSLKFVMLTDTKMSNLRIVLHQIYVGLFVEYVVKNPLSPAEHPDGLGVDCESFELGLDQFINGSLQG